MLYHMHKPNLKISEMYILLRAVQCYVYCH